MSLKIIYLDFKNTPRNKWYSKVTEKISNKLLDSFQSRKDKSQNSFSNNPSWELYDPQLHFINIDQLELSDKEKENLSVYSNYCLNHRFDILGSGWKSWSYNSNFFEELNIKNEAKFYATSAWLEKVVNSGNLKTSQSIWKKIQEINSSYIPIDWQKNVKNNFRYSSKTWFRHKISDAKSKHSDIKIPWEMSRMQHLIRMLICVKKLGSKEFEILKEIQCQLLDFIMANPPRWGVNWRSAMEVSIRVANMAFILQIMRQFNSLHDDFISIVKNSICDHLLFIKRYDESNSGLGNNHYLSNLSGFLCAASIFKPNPWLMAESNNMAQNLLYEIDKQFLEDGGNFESSSAYHCLSLEMSLYGLVSVEHLIKLKMFENNRFLEGIQVAKDKLRLAGDLMQNMMKPDGDIPQFGDNDSARFIKILVQGDLLTNDVACAKYLNLTQKSSISQEDNVYLDEDMLDYSSCLDLFKSYILSDKDSKRRVVIKEISTNPVTKSSRKDLEIQLFEKPKLVKEFVQTNTYPLIKDDKIDLRKNLSKHFYPQTGFYIFKGDHIHLMINGSNRCVQQYWPHGHNDKLSFDLYINGKSIFRDPGSYIYTSNSELRNAYRSEKAHNVPLHNTMQNTWPAAEQGVFRMEEGSKVEVLNYSDTGLTLMLKFNDVIHVREWIIHDHSLEVIDQSNKDFEVNVPSIEFSNGYGKRLANLQ